MTSHRTTRVHGAKDSPWKLQGRIGGQINAVSIQRGQTRGGRGFSARDPTQPTEWITADIHQRAAALSSRQQAFFLSCVETKCSVQQTKFANGAAGNQFM